MCPPHTDRGQILVKAPDNELRGGGGEEGQEGRSFEDVFYSVFSILVRTI